GPYRALAQHVYGDFQKGDVAGAAAMGRVLERLWDKAEDYGGDTALSKTNHKLFEEIDKTMDEFLTPLWAAKAKPPDPAKVKAAYNAPRAVATGSRAARSAGKKPPRTPITIAKTTPSTSKLGVIMKAKARLEKV